MKNYKEIKVHVAFKAQLADLLENEMYEQFSIWEEFNIKDAKAYADELQRIINELRRA